MSISIILLSLVLAFVLPFVIFIIMFYNWKWPSHSKLYRKIPSPKLLPVFGIGLDLIKLKDTELLNYFETLKKQCGPIFYIEFLGIPGVMLTEPQDVELILNNVQHISKGREYDFMKPWLCEGLLTSAGKKWHTRRRLLTPAFHFKILQNFIPIFNRNAKLLTKKFTCAKNTAVDTHSYVSLCALDILCETSMGVTLDIQLGEASEYVSAIKKASKIIMKIITTFWMYNAFLFWISPTGREYSKVIHQLHRFTDKVIKDRKERYQSSYAYGERTEIGKQKPRKSFLDCLIETQRENPNEITDLGIREEVDLILFAGYDTTSVSITWTLFMIACHEDVQTKLQEEIQRVFQGDSERDVTLQDLHQLNYLEMVIKETLRLYPSVPYFSRLLTTDIKIRDYVIPRNTNISIVPYCIHRNADIYPDPEKFIPERFLPEVTKERHPYAYIPFSAGYRNCMGQKFALLEEKVVISTILRKLKLSTALDRDQVKVINQIVLIPDQKIEITFTSYC